MTDEEAVEALKTLLMVPVEDMEEMMVCVRHEDWERLRKTITRIKHRKHKYGI